MTEMVNERATPITRVTFTDENGDPVIPTAAYYRIDDLGSLTEIRSDTEIQMASPASAIADIRWTQSDTQILNQSRLIETRIMTVYWFYGSASPANQGTEEFIMHIKNLSGMPSASPT